MLQSNKVQREFGRDLEATETLSAAESFQTIVDFVRRRYSIIIFVSLLTISVGLIYVITARPSYTAHAQLLIDAHKVQVFRQQSVFSDLPIDTAQVDSQVEVLKSENIAAAVIKKLHLDNLPEFVGPGGGLIGAIFGLVADGFGSDQQTASDYELTRAAIGSFESRLSIKRIGLSYVIDIGFKSYDADRAAQIANAVADAYINDQLETKYLATKRAGGWLQDRIKELRDGVTTAERAVVEYKAKNNIVSTGGNDKQLVSEQQVSELNSQLVVARAHTAEVKARLDRINSVLAADAPNDSLNATVADTLKSDIVSKLRSQYLELLAREQLWSAKYGPNHLAVVNLRNQMREIRNSIFDELKRLGESYKSDYAIAKQGEDGVRKELELAVARSQQGDIASVTLQELESNAQTYKSLYENFLQRYMEAVQQESFPITETRLISPASKPLGKSDPKSFLIITIAGMGGIFIGVGLGILRDLSDRVFRTSEQIESQLGVDCIALVPYLRAESTNKKESVESFQSRIAGGFRLATSTAKGPINIDEDAADVDYKSEMSTEIFGQSGETSENLNIDRTIVRPDRTIWDVVDAPFSRFTEAIRSIKLAIDLNGVSETNRIIGLTSSLPGEGKSTLSTALAQLMAQVGKRVILIDCDLRNPALTRALTPKARSGMLEVVTEKASLENVTWNDPSTGMTFLPVVMRSRFAHSNEILRSAAVKKLFDQLRKTYDYIVVDLPPLAPIVDVRVTSHLIDSYVFVVEWGRTKTDIVEHALAHAQPVQESLLGVVLNKINMDTFARYTGNREGYFYNKNYGRYGYTD